MDSCPVMARGSINKRVLMEIKTCLVPLYVRLVAIVLGAVFSVLLIITINRSYIISILSLTCIVVLCIFYQYCLAAVIKQQLDIWDVLFHASGLVYNLYFQEQAICLTVQGNKESPVSIPYSEFRAVTECRNYYLMTTYNKIMIVIEKETLNISRVDWKNFLCEKCMQIKKFKLNF